MSALLRPHGDKIATVYGSYKSKKEVKKIVKGDKLDILCSDGLNYHVEVKETGASGRLHFRHWSVKHDYIGSFDDLYLANQGAYSEGISAQNTYPALVKGENSGDKLKGIGNSKSTSSSSTTDARPQNFPSGTRYPEDFLSKPRFASSHSRKRTADELEDIDSKKYSREIGGIDSSAVDEKTSDSADQNIVDGDFDKVDVFSNFLNEKPILADDRRDKSNSRQRRQSNEKKIQKLAVQEPSSVDGKSINQTSISSNSKDRLNDIAVSPASSGSATKFKSAAMNSNEEDKDKSSLVIEDVTNPFASTMCKEDKVSTSSSNIESPAVQQVSRVIPVYQLQVQRTAQIKYLREMLAMDKSLVDIGRAIDTITNHPIVFHSGNSSSIYTAQQLLCLLQARRKIDEVIQHVLGTL